ncbi:PQQ-dependent sugar dehydrogenase [Flavobacterium sp.]|uniref:PQQ-dependent sugar dehydrogenase n=1 Tax=Flavobacterium sp. TaxID=239 RepID=UPI0032652D33
MKNFKKLKISKVERKLFFFFIFCLMWNVNFAQTFPTNFAGVQLATGLDPVGMDVVPDGRVFLTEKVGKIRVIKNGALLSTPLITIPTVDNFSERGLMKVVVDENFATNGYIYAFYTHKANNVVNNRVSRFTVSGDIASPGSELVLINIDAVDGNTGYHNGGGLAIKNNQIYISTGESTVASNAQSFTTLKGKVLRINTDGTIPTDNPYYTSASGVYRAIWALGLRNPFKLSVENGTGKILCNDVGAGTWEEINEIQKGKNYGWPTIEGIRTNQTAPANYKDPFYVYNHSNGACSITAGAFYNPVTAVFPTSYIGKYFFGDYCAGWLKTIDANGTVATFATGIDRPLDVAVSKDGVLYFIARGGIDGGSNDANTSSSEGVLWKVNYTGNGIPVIGVQPANRTVSIGQSTTFQIVASGNPTPAFQWQRNNVDIAGATQSSYTLTNPVLADNGAQYKVKVTNSAGSVTSNPATLTVINNQSPVPVITAPTTGTQYSGGNVITFTGTATDTEDGTLPASAFTWRIDLFHFDDPQHSHPALDFTSGIKTGTFTIPTDMETSPNVLFRIFLTVTDSNGASKTVSSDIVPVVSTVNLVTNPPGLKLKLDGSQVTAPYSFTGAKGINRAIEAPSPQTLNGNTYVFSSWSDNGTQAHTISTPDNGFSYTANFTLQQGGNTIVNGGIYEMEPQHSLGKRLDVNGASAENGALVEMYTRNGNSNQQWKFISLGNDIYLIEPQNAIGKRLDVSGNSSANNALINLYQNNNNANQKWKAYPIADQPGLYRFEPQNALGKRLDIELIGGTDKAASRTLDTGNSQKWKLYPVSSFKTQAAVVNTDQSNGFYAYPNPFSSATTITFPVDNSKEKKSIDIFNLQGKLLRTIDITENKQGEISIDRNDLQKGMYVYRLKINNNIASSKKIIIE